MASQSELLTCKEAAQVLGVTPVRVRQFCQEGRLGQKLGDRWVIPKSELHQFKKIPRNSGRHRNGRS
jgi:excisionase family DNA binding protein